MNDGAIVDKVPTIGRMNGGAQRNVLDEAVRMEPKQADDQIVTFAKRPSLPENGADRDEFTPKVRRGKGHGVPVPPRPAADPPARDGVYDLIRRSILIGEYPGGTFIEEEKISERAGVSRTPVREAFHRLHAEQYIDLMPRKGAMVRQISPQELKGLFEARLLLEGNAMETICRDRVPITATIVHAIEAMREIRDATDGNAMLRFIAMDWSLHCAIIEMGGNDVIIEMYRSLRSRYDRVVRTIKLTPEHLEKVYLEHIQLLGLLQAFDIAGLKRTLKSHLTAE
jgi:DNA-binding GntR family transcriptional regulator